MKLFSFGKTYFYTSPEYPWILVIHYYWFRLPDGRAFAMDITLTLGEWFFQQSLKRLGPFVKASHGHYPKTYARISQEEIRGLASDNGGFDWHDLRGKV